MNARLDERARRLFIASAMAIALAGPAKAQPFTAGSTGHVLYHPDIILIFWGGSFQDPTSATSAFKVTGALQQLVNGGYFNQLYEYNLAGFPQISQVFFENSAPCTPANGTCTITESQVTGLINSRIQANTLPAPSANAEQIYSVVLPKGVSVSTSPNGGGRHDKSSFNGTSYYFSWSLDVTGDMTHFGSPLLSITHELVETITDPEFNQGFTCAPPNNAWPGRQEIADICEGAMWNGAMVAQYWSQSLSRCVLPSGSTAIMQYNNSPGNWTIVSPIGVAVSQVAAGPFGLVATDIHNNLFRYNGTPGSWTGIGGAVGLIAVGSNTIYATFPDLVGGVFRYTPNTSTGWTSMSGLPLNLYASAFGVFATALGDNSLFKWSSGTTWNAVGGWGSMFAANSNSVIGLMPDHSAVTRLTSSGWTNPPIGGPASQIYAAYGIVAGTLPVAFSSNPATRHDVLFSWSGGTNPMWVPQSPPGYTFAAAQTGLYGLALDGSGVYQSSNPTATSSPPWTQIGGQGGVATRLIGGGTQLYATVGREYAVLGDTGDGRDSCCQDYSKPCSLPDLCHIVCDPPATHPCSP